MGQDGCVPALTAAGCRLVIREPHWFQHRLFKGPDTDINMPVFSAGQQWRHVQRHAQAKSGLVQEIIDGAGD